MATKKSTNNKVILIQKEKTKDIRITKIPRHYRTFVSKVASHWQNKRQKKQWKLSLPVYVCKSMDLGSRNSSK